MKPEMTNRKKAALETRRRLIVAARKILYKRDFAEVSVADIAKEAGVARQFLRLFQAEGRHR